MNTLIALLAATTLAAIALAAGAVWVVVRYALSPDPIASVATSTENQVASLRSDFRGGVSRSECDPSVPTAASVSEVFRAPASAPFLDEADLSADEHQMSLTWTELDETSARMHREAVVEEVAEEVEDDFFTKPKLPMEDSPWFPSVGNISHPTAANLVYMRALGFFPGYGPKDP